MIDDNTLQIENVLFLDESTFNLHVHVNQQNCRYLSRENPQWMRELRTQNPEKVNVWAGIIGENIIGPFFIDGNLNGETYLALLQNNVVLTMANLYPAEGNPQLPGNALWFQQDGAPRSQCPAISPTIFPNRWIGRCGSVEWPTRSPDLTSLNFFLYDFDD
ncbi:hypothetical protein NQ318_012999 [Aromia moschata]|uniref:Uncharacterized protein n=1 Tax=Aromia moschata TaxID=1265417 RepID=A0AAV8Y0A9_9CUCU|nr:hypothetical protein NQ318_012999 [Aromia moschata]